MTLVESIVIEMAEADGQVNGSTYLDEPLQKAIHKKAIQLGMKYALGVGRDAEELSDELFQIGCEAAAKYSKNYDAERPSDLTGEPVKPMTYLMKCAWGAMQKRCNEYYNDNITNVSMDASTGEDDDEEDAGTLHDVMADENAVDPSQEADRKEATEALMAALRQLPKRQRYVITSIYGIGCEEKNQRVLAQELGITYKQVWHEMNRARTALRALLKDFA